MALCSQAMKARIIAFDLDCVGAQGESAFVASWSSLWVGIPCELVFAVTER